MAKQSERPRNDALAMIARYGGIDGADHKQWLLDQVVRILAYEYAEWVAGYQDGEDGPKTYTWSEGVSPIERLQASDRRLGALSDLSDSALAGTGRRRRHAKGSD